MAYGYELSVAEPAVDPPLGFGGRETGKVGRQRAFGSVLREKMKEEVGDIACVILPVDFLIKDVNCWGIEGNGKAAYTGQMRRAH